MADRWRRLQDRLDRAWRANLPEAATEHLVIVLPSHSADPVLLAHYADRLAPLEHRYVAAALLLRNPFAHVAYVSSVPPPDYVLEEYLRLLRPDIRDTVPERMHFLAVDDTSPRSLAAKVLEHPDVVQRLRDLARGRPTFIDPWNVTENEQRLALAVDVPIYGTDPDLWVLGTKSRGRRMFKEIGVAVPDGAEDVFTLDDVVDAVTALRQRHDGLAAVIVKLNDSASGDGNAVIDLAGLPPPGDPADEHGIRTRLRALPGWYVQTLAVQGGVVEVRITGDPFRSPSAQVAVTPSGDAVVLSTHDQVLGGHAGQVYHGCRFPADPGYAAEVGALGLRVGRRLAERGVRGRLAVDFAARPSGGGRWDLFALEVNLRKGGTTHPLGTMRNLIDGQYDANAGEYRDGWGEPVHYAATDNYVDSRWTSVSPRALQAAARDAGLAFDPAQRGGAVLHLLDCLPVDGRFGVTAIAPTAEAAQGLYDRVGEVAESLCP